MIDGEAVGDGDQRAKRSRAVSVCPDCGKSAWGEMLADVSLGEIPRPWTGRHFMDTPLLAALLGIPRAAGEAGKTMVSQQGRDEDLSDT